MIIAIASGKGGTGKTSVAINLAMTATGPVQLADCDVEEPNVHLFVPGRTILEETVCLAVPVFDNDRCNGCEECVEFCQFNALALIGTTPMVFPELCHGCGGCQIVCSRAVITEREFRIGTITTTQAGMLTLKTGRLDVGVARASSLVHDLKKRLGDSPLTILDAPPGTACQAVATLRGSDFVVLVTEPTPFGLHDLRLAVTTVRELNLPFGVVINRSGCGDGRVHEYCATERIPLLLEIPDDRRIAEAYSRGQIMIDALPEYRSLFEQLWRNIESQYPEVAIR